jgi:hypothetical protein
MKTYLANIIPKIKGVSQKLDNLTMLTNHHWVIIDELQNSNPRGARGNEKDDTH